MAKSNESNKSQKSAAPEPDPTATAASVEALPAAPSLAPAVEPPVGEQSQELAVPADPLSIMDLAAKLPSEYQDMCMALRRVTRDEINAIVEALPEASRAAFKALIAKNNPQRLTRVVAEARFRPPHLRLYQGTGEPPQNPRLPKGGVEDGNGTVKIVPPLFAEDWPGVPHSMRVVVLAVNEGRAFWPKKAPNGDPILPPGIKLASANQMICGSNDRKVGDRFGSCSTCVYRPQMDSEERQCKDQADLFVIFPDLGGLYQVTLNASSFKSALAPMRKRMDSWDADYTGQFKLEPEQVTRNNNTFYVWKATAITNREHPNGVPNAPELMALFEVLSRQIMTEVVLPRIAETYEKAAAHGGLGSQDTTAGGGLIGLKAAAAEEASRNYANTVPA